MVNTFLWLNVLVFAFLSGLHLYWVLGGKWAIANALPQNPENHQPVMNPGKAVTFLVALVLLFFALFTTALALPFVFSGRIFSNTYVLLGIGILFLLRATGDFKYVGLSKKIKTTSFAKLDSKLYTPLCLYIGLSNLICFEFI